MKAEYINPFILATKAVFETMLNCPLERGQPYMKEGNQPEHEISGIIGYSGRAKGSVVLSLSRGVALGAAKVMLQEDRSVIDDDVVDTVGELVNMVAGAAKAHLEELELRITLPTIITGKSHCVEFPSRVVPICIPFHCQWGDVLVEYGLVEETEESLVAS